MVIYEETFKIELILNGVRLLHVYQGYDTEREVSSIWLDTVEEAIEAIGGFIRGVDFEPSPDVAGSSYASGGDEQTSSLENPLAIDLSRYTLRGNNPNRKGKSGNGIRRSY